MNEELIRRVISFKLDLAGKILERLPAGPSERARKLGSIIYESLGAHLNSGEKQSNAKEPGKISSVPIE